LQEKHDKKYENIKKKPHNPTLKKIKRLRRGDSEREKGEKKKTMQGKQKRECLKSEQWKRQKCVKKKGLP